MATARPRRRRVLGGAAVAGALTVALSTALVPAVSADDGSGGDITRLIVAESRTAENFNPFTPYFAISDEVNRLNYDSLIRWSAEDYAPVPGLAESWEESEDGLTWTYHIRDGVTFSDGEPLTAQDAEFTYRTMMTDETARSAALDLVENFVSVEATDDTTLVIKLKEPSTQMLALENPIVPEHVWRDIDIAEYDGLDFPTVGSGPFQTVEYRTDQFIRLRANPEYWGEDKPKYDELVYQYYKTPDAAVQALLQGEVDVVTSLTPDQFRSLEGQEGITTNRAQGRRTQSVTFNPGARAQDGAEIGDGHPALRDARVRQAIHHAVDRQRIIETVYGGYATPGVAYVPRLFSEFFWEPEGEDVVEFDLDRANEILDEAGYARGPDGIRMMPDGSRPLEFRLLHHADMPTYQTAAQFFEEWWEQLGLQINVESADSTKLNDMLYAGQFDIIFSGWGGGPDPSSLLGLYTCSGLPATADSTDRNTDTFYCNEDYDRLYDQQVRETDLAERQELVDELQRILYTEAPMITFTYADQLEAYRSDRWTGFVTQPAERGMILNQMGRWGFTSATPVESDDEGSNVAPWAIGGATAVVGAAAVLIAVLYRRRTAEERE